MKLDLKSIDINSQTVYKELKRYSATKNYHEKNLKKN